MYKTHNYIQYREQALRPEPAEVAGIAEYFPQVGVKIPNNLFTGLDRVNPTELHKPDLLPKISLGLCKHMMEWVDGFRKKHKQQQAFDDTWKEIPPYPGLSVPQKAYHELPQ